MSGIFVGLTVAAVSTYSSYTQQKKAAKSQKAAQEAQARGASVEAARSRISQIREARIRAGQIEAAAGTSGVGQASSGVAGSISSIGSQAGSNIGAINVQQGFAEAASANLQDAANASLKAAGWQAIGSFANQAFVQQGGWPKVFGGNTPTGVQSPAPVEYRTGKP